MNAAIVGERPRELQIKGILPGHAPVSVTKKGLGFTVFRQRLAELKEEKPEEWDAINKSIKADVERGSAPGSVHVDSIMKDMSIAYANDEFIGDRLMPFVQSDGLSGKYFEYPKTNQTAYPDDELNDRSLPNEVNRKITEKEVSLIGRALSEHIDKATLENQTDPLSELVDAQFNVLHGLHFLREKRQATILTTAGSYTNSTTVSTKWDTSSGKPVNDVADALRTTWTGRGPGKWVGFMSLAVWDKLKVNDQLLDMFKYTSGGVVTMQQVANAFGLDDLLIGSPRENTANENQTASYSRIWGDVFGIVRVASMPSKRNVGFGVTFADRAAHLGIQKPSELEGVYGGVTVKYSRYERQHIVGADAGHLLLAPLT